METTRSIFQFSRVLATVCLAWCLSNLALAEGDVASGEAKAASCAACHGPGGNSLSPAVFPVLAGREVSQLVELLKAYRSGEKNNPIMSPQAQALSDQDILDLAAYFSAQ